MKDSRDVLRLQQILPFGRFVVSVKNQITRVGDDLLAQNYTSGWLALAVNGRKRHSIRVWQNPIGFCICQPFFKYRQRILRQFAG